MNEIIRVAEWTRTPGPRWRSQGHFSAEQFWDEVLGPVFERVVLQNGARLTIDLDGAAGYLPSFVEETFGGMARKYGAKFVEDHVEIVYHEDPITLEDAWDYVRNPRPEKRRYFPS